MSKFLSKPVIKAFHIEVERGTTDAGEEVFQEGFRKTLSMIKRARLPLLLDLGIAPTSVNVEGPGQSFNWNAVKGRPPLPPQPPPSTTHRNLVIAGGLKRSERRHLHPDLQSLHSRHLLGSRSRELIEVFLPIQGWRNNPEKPQLVIDDPWLEPFTQTIEARIQKFKEWQAKIDETEGGLDPFSKGYEKFGLIAQADRSILYRGMGSRRSKCQSDRRLQ
ncbi:alpha-1,4-glucan branching enzyme [Puccinia graminis f. sp. tritici]|uniref:Alpha-1,4-glucan branching enzyme n=1 Tax=Puccinia graminis f. sp. tritici TaxID=56615 RepID=A0A5B0LK18_PUCGR|nr:alpha-1,4-glucan branching enzyme [Puccinia graminis f. sp. tritici]